MRALVRKPGLASAEATADYARGFEGRLSRDHFRPWNGLTLSSIGLGTYLGPADDETDALYRKALRRAVELGCNVIDTAINYRFQRSERAIGETLEELLSGPRAAEAASAAGDRAGPVAGHPQQLHRGAGSGQSLHHEPSKPAGRSPLTREALVISTKGGFFSFEGLPPASPRTWIERTFVETGVITWDQVVADCHCMAPAYLKNQLETSLRNLRLEAVDIYYLHNPETQLGDLDRAAFLRRVRAAFEFLEGEAAEGKIGVYGTATWNGYRHPEKSPDYLSLSELVALAREVAGDEHRFRAVQLPVNLAMAEALARPNQTGDDRQVPLLEAASRLGMIVMSSGSIYQGQLARELPPAVEAAFPGLETDAQRALQFARSAPGITTALVGMKTIGHVEENLALARHPPASASQVRTLFR